MGNFWVHIFTFSQNLFWIGDAGFDEEDEGFDEQLEEIKANPDKSMFSESAYAVIRGNWNPDNPDAELSNEIDPCGPVRGEEDHI